MNVKQRGGLLLFFLVSFFFTGLAQTNEVILAGFVRDSVSGETLIGTNILLYKDSITAAQSPFRGVATNNYGFYAIPKLTRGIYYLIARNIGYKISVQEINISISNGRVQNDINMIPENIKLKEVIVEGKKKPEVNASTIDLNTDIIKQLPSLSGEVDLFKILQTLPGVKSGGELSSGLYVRGGSPDQNLTLLDGVIIYNPDRKSVV